MSQYDWQSLAIFVFGFMNGALVIITIVRRIYRSK